MKDLRIKVERFYSHGEMVDEGHDAEHLKQQSGTLVILWKDVSRENEPYGTASTGFPGCLETTADVGERIAVCVNSCAGIENPRHWIDKAVATLRQLVADLSAGEAIKYHTFRDAEKLVAEFK